MAVAFPSTPPGLTPPLTENNDENHSGLIAIIMSFAMFLVLGSLGIRIYSAYARRARGIDDRFFAFIVVGFCRDAKLKSITHHHRLLH